MIRVHALQHWSQIMQQFSNLCSTHACSCKLVFLQQSRVSSQFIPHSRVKMASLPYFFDEFFWGRFKDISAFDRNAGKY